MEKINNNNLIKLIFKWKIHLLIVFLVSIILSFLFSSSVFIKPKFKSSAIIYPSNLIPYSSETPTEQMLQIFRSDFIMDGIIEKFNLCHHYNIDSSKTHYRSTLKKAYETNVSIDKTQYESVVINVLDIEPETACEIVKEMINLFNLKVRYLQRDKTKEIIKIWEGLLVQKKRQMDSLENRLNILRKDYRILDIEMQTQEATKEYVRSNTNKKTIASELLKNLENSGGEFIQLQDHLKVTNEAYNEIKLNYETSLSDLSKELTYTNIVSKPVAADKKSYPVRWIIVMLSVIASLFLTILVIVIVEKFSEAIKEFSKD